MTFREIRKKLLEDGWIEVRQRGSHVQFEHPQKKGKVTVPMHSGDIPLGTLNNILKQADLRLKK